MKIDSFAPVRCCAHIVRHLTLVLAALVLTAQCPAQDSVLVGDYSGSRVVKFAFPSGTAQSHFVGTGMTNLSAIYAMTYGPDGALYMASYNNDRVIKVDGQTGEPLGDFVAAGAGGLNGASAVCFGPDGRLYVSSRLSHAVGQYNGTTGAFIQLFVTPSSGSLTNPDGLAFDGAGNLYVCSYGNDKVLKYNGATGAFMEETLTAGQLGLNGPRGILFDPTNDRMYVSSSISYAIIVKDPGQAPSVLVNSTTLPTLREPSFMDFAPNGGLLVACYNNGTVQRLNRATGASLGTLVQAGAGGTASALSVLYKPSQAGCYANCDNSSIAPVLNIGDFVCFINKYAAGCP